MNTHLPQFILSAASALTLVASLGVTAESREPAMDPTDILRKEHGIIRKMAGAAETTARSMRRRDALPAQRIAKFHDFFSNFADRCHHAKEEDELFPAMREQGVDSTIIELMIKQHEEGRILLSGIERELKSQEQGRRADEAQVALAVYLDQYASLMDRHIETENSVLWPQASQALSAPQKARLIEAFQRIETKELGEGFHEKYHGLAMDILGSSKASAGQAHILMVVTSHGKMRSGKQTGLWLEEFATPHKLFTDAGCSITVASPAGGKTPVDPRSLTESAKPDNAESALEELRDTAALRAADLSEYDAVFFPGGHGTMFDFPSNTPVQNTVEYFLNSGQPVALVCHGPAALVGAVDPQGSPIVKGRNVAVFTNEEERSLELVDEVPFLLQSRLESLGATVVTAERFTENVIVDGQLVTGQNPASSGKAARELLSLLGIREPEPDQE